MRRRSVVLVAVAVAVVGLAAGVTIDLLDDGAGTSAATSEACATTPPLIAVAGGDDMVSGLSTVSVIRADGTTTAVTGDWVATEPEISPDGQRLVLVRADGDYESAGPGSTTLWTMALDGSDPRPLTVGEVSDNAPAWSPDGSTIAFRRQGATASIFTVPVTGGEPVPLLPGTTPEGAATTPEWSPDGSRLAFVRRAYDELGLGTESTVWTVAADGSDAREVAGIHGEAQALDWHPDGTRLLVSATTPDGEETSIVDLASGRATLLSRDAAYAHWSRGGTQVVHYQRRGSEWHLVERPFDGAGLGEGRDLGVTQGFLYPYLDIAVAACAP